MSETEEQDGNPAGDTERLKTTPESDTAHAMRRDQNQRRNEDNSKREENNDDLFEKESILLNPDATLDDILQKYREMRKQNDYIIEAILQKEGRLTREVKVPPPSAPSPEETEQRASTPTTEKRWTIEPNPLILEPPYVLMDTIELKTNNAEEETFRAVVSENPPDWLLSILPDTGLLKYVKNGGILITCEPKSYTDSKSRQVQNGRIQVFVADEMKELEVCIKYIPIEIEKWVSAARRPCGRHYVKSNAQQRKFKEKNQQKDVRLINQKFFQESDLHAKRNDSEVCDGAITKTQTISQEFFQQVCISKMLPSKYEERIMFTQHSEATRLRILIYEGRVNVSEGKMEVVLKWPRSYPVPHRGERVKQRMMHDDSFIDG
ncbi:uncharacterized protein [Periplaneta americana]|uniref:uncharacterized protein n=1 Tax=Periplaneta americana TaxID=6978 RepID=UPI0037E78829